MDSKTIRPTKVVTGKVRLSYLHVFEPKAIGKGQDLKYSVCILIPKTEKDQLLKIKAAIEAAKKEGIPSWGGKLPPNLKLPLRDGDAERPDQMEYIGHYFLNTNSKNKPGVVDRELNPILDQTDIYSGCYGRVSINFYPFNQDVNKGVACGLQHVQKLQDGEPLGGITRPEDDFGSLSDLGEDDDFLK